MNSPHEERSKARFTRGGIATLRRLQQQAAAFLHERGIERADQTRQSLLFRVAHFWLLVAKSFIRNRCPVRASALAYTTLLALVPLLAVGASIAAGLLQTKGTKPVEEFVESLVKNVAPALDLKASEGDGGGNRQQVVTTISEFIARIQSGTLGVTSTIALVFVAIGLLRTIEAAFNDIWGVTSGRGWVASIIQYWATITLGPIVLIVVLGLTTGPQFQRLLALAGSSSLQPNDVKDLSGLARKLTERSDPLSVYVSGRLQTRVLSDLAILATNGVPVGGTRQATTALLENLNQIIAGVSIYDSNRFATVTLLPRTEALINEQPVDQMAPRLNRLLLETAYPHQLLTKQRPFVESIAFQLLPFIVLSLAFGMFYQLMPNTHVQWQAALAGGIVGGTLWQLNNKLSVLYVSKAITYSKIYGSFGVIPLFLIGMYFSWLILLFGAQVAYAYQNRQAYLEEKQAESVHQRGREFIALRILANVARDYSRGQRPPTVPQLAESLGVPTKLVAQLLGVFLNARLVAEVNDEDTGYVPARPIDTITAHDIVQALRVGAGQELDPRDDGLLARVRTEFERISGAEKQVATGVTLKDLVSL